MSATPRILAAIDGVHMGLGHDGLAELAKKFKINLKALGEGNLVLFLNRGRDKLKCVGGQGMVVAYVKMPGGRKLPLDAIQFIPKTFARSGKIDLDQAITESVKAAMEKKSKERGNEFYPSSWV